MSIMNEEKSFIQSFLIGLSKLIAFVVGVLAVMQIFYIIAWLAILLTNSVNKHKMAVPDSIWIFAENASKYYFEYFTFGIIVLIILCCFAYMISYLIFLVALLGGYRNEKIRKWFEPLNK